MKLQVAALPPDVRKGCAFPVFAFKILEAMPHNMKRHSLKIGESFTGQAEPFRTSGGIAAKNSI